MSEAPKRKRLKIAAAVALSMLLIGGFATWQGTQLRPDPNQLARGASAPRLSLSDSAGVAHPLAPATGQAAAVLVFYRGHW